MQNKLRYKVHVQGGPKKLQYYKVQLLYIMTSKGDLYIKCVKCFIWSNTVVSSVTINIPCARQAKQYTKNNDSLFTCHGSLPVLQRTGCH